MTKMIDADASRPNTAVMSRMRNLSLAQRGRLAVLSVMCRLTIRWKREADAKKM